VGAILIGAAVGFLCGIWVLAVSDRLAARTIAGYLLTGVLVGVVVQAFRCPSGLMWMAAGVVLAVWVMYHRSVRSRCSTRR